VRALRAEAVTAVRRYFEGEETDFSSVKLDLGEQDPFFKRVYAAARRVGWGHTTTHGALAKELGAGPEAARDVGQAMTKNPMALIIPCHRVLAAGGKVADFPRQAARRPRSACFRWRAFTWSRRHRHSNLSGFEAARPSATTDPGSSNNPARPVSVNRSFCADGLNLQENGLDDPL
jgi:O-6-methylguanine DNA methyltransferase